MNKPISLATMNILKPAAISPGWKKSFLWLALAVACFHAAYASLKFPAAGLLIFGYAYGLIRLADQPNVRRAFYFGLATGLLSYAPQLFFFFRIFNVAAVVLWLVLAFWVGLFAAIVCGSARRWGSRPSAKNSGRTSAERHRLKLSEIRRPHRP